jgi:hypothetical protein
MVFKILASYPDGFAVLSDLKRDMATTSGRDWAERTKRLAHAFRISTSPRRRWSSA